MAGRNAVVEAERNPGSYPVTELGVKAIFKKADIGAVEECIPGIQIVFCDIRLLTGERERKRERLLRESGLPSGKTLGNLEEGQLPAKVRRQLPTLLEGGFLERAENLLVFGLPGRGKTHFL